jgi:[protein-PII] uridylyltransferase
VVVPCRFSAYSEASKAVFDIFRDTTPLVEGLSIDEAFLDVRGMRRIAGLPREIAVRLGYTEHPGMQDVERFMKHYFLVAKDVGDLTGILCAALEEEEGKPLTQLGPVD